MITRFVGNVHPNLRFLVPLGLVALVSELGVLLIAFH